MSQEVGVIALESLLLQTLRYDWQKTACMCSVGLQAYGQHRNDAA
jgi:hypothetical protein